MVKSSRQVIRYLWPQLARGRGEAERELTTEELRWSVRGEVRTRETFGDPHPADFKGRFLGVPTQAPPPPS